MLLVYHHGLLLLLLLAVVVVVVVVWHYTLWKVWRVHLLRLGHTVSQFLHAERGRRGAVRTLSAVTADDPVASLRVLSRRVSPCSSQRYCCWRHHFLWSLRQFSLRTPRR